MQRAGRGAIVMLSALAGAAGLAWWSSDWSPLKRSDLDELAAAIGSDLPFEARPSGGFSPPARHVLRGSEIPGGVSLSPDARIAVAELEKRAAADPSPNALAAVGVAYLVNGEVDRAIATLEDVSPMLNTAPPWNDLSAAYLVKAQRVPQRRIEYLSRALEVAATSMRLAPSNEARFNRALALEGLAPFVGQPAPWREYISTERDPRWIESAKRHEANERPPEDRRGRWDERQRELRARLAKRDRAFAEETVKLFAEGSSEVFGQLILAWAKAKLANDVVASRSAIEEAALLADAFGLVTGDRMPSDEMAVVRVGGAVLAQAHLAYAEGVRASNAVDYQKAKDSLLRARSGFSRSRSTYVKWTEVMLATILFQQRDLSAADRELANVEGLARARKHETLLGRTLWLRGLVYSKDWRLTEAFVAFRAAASCFEQAGEHEFAVSIYSLLADTLRTLGEHHRSWENIGKTLEGLQRVRNPQRRYLLLYNATLFASNQDLLESALLFQHAAVREASKAAAAAAVEALTQRALLHQRKSDRINAERDLSDALTRLTDVPEGPVNAHLKAEIDVVTAQLEQGKSGDAAEEKLTRAIAFFRTTEPARIPGLYLDLARMRLRDRSFDDAEEALSEGIATLEKQRSSLSDESLKISYFDESWELFKEMVALQHGARADAARAFEYAERSRARSLLAAVVDTGGSDTRDLPAIQAVLPSSMVLVYYATLPDRLLVWTVTSATSRLDETQLQEDDLSRLVTQHRSAITERRENIAVNDRLYDVLIRPAAATLKANATIVFVPDGHLHQLPFATLRNPETRRYVIEDHPVLITPSASFFVAALARLQQRHSELTSALLIGNPGSATLNGAVPALPGAEAEVVEVAKHYPRHTVLTGADATKERFVQAAPEYDVVHFGGHAFVNAEYPLLSRLSFSAEGGDAERPLFAHEISRLRFSRTQVVVLAACSTAAGMVSRGEGAVSVARPFLGAGVPTVVASQWDVDDLATQQLFLEFHRALSTTKNPVTALRTAQLSLLRSANPALATPASWGAFVALGTTAP